MAEENPDKFIRTIVLKRPELSPDCVGIAVKDGAVIIDEKSFKQLEDGSWAADGTYTRIPLPRHVDTTKLSSTINDGPPKELTIEAPYLDPKEEAKNQGWTPTWLPREMWSMEVPVPDNIDPDKATMSIEGNVVKINTKILIDDPTEDANLFNKGLQDFESKLTLPERVNMNKINFSWPSSGVLRVEAPFKSDEKVTIIKQ